MKKRLIYLLSVVALTTTYTACAADGSFRHSGRAVQHSGNAIGYSLVATGQFVAGALAIPLGFSAQVGTVSGQMSDELWEAANAPIGAPLPITEQTITVGPPPGEAINHKGDRP